MRGMSAFGELELDPAVAPVGDLVVAGSIGRYSPKPPRQDVPAGCPARSKTGSPRSPAPPTAPSWSGTRPSRIGCRSVWPSTRRIQSMPGGIRAATSSRVGPAARSSAWPCGSELAEPEANSSSDWKTNRSPTTRRSGRSPSACCSWPKNSERYCSSSSTLRASARRPAWRRARRSCPAACRPWSRRLASISLSWSISRRSARSAARRGSSAAAAAVSLGGGLLRRRYCARGRSTSALAAAAARQRSLPASLALCDPRPGLQRVPSGQPTGRAPERAAAGSAFDQRAVVVGLVQRAGEVVTCVSSAACAAAVLANLPGQPVRSRLRSVDLVGQRRRLATQRFVGLARAGDLAGGLIDLLFQKVQAPDRAPRWPSPAGPAAPACARSSPGPRRTTGRAARGRWRVRCLRSAAGGTARAMTGGRKVRRRLSLRSFCALAHPPTIAAPGQNTNRCDEHSRLPPAWDGPRFRQAGAGRAAAGVNPCMFGRNAHDLQSRLGALGAAAMALALVPVDRRLGAGRDGLPDRHHGRAQDPRPARRVRHLGELYRRRRVHGPADGCRRRQADPGRRRELDDQRRRPDLHIQDPRPYVVGRRAGDRRRLRLLVPAHPRPEARGRICLAPLSDQERRGVQHRHDHRSGPARRQGASTRRRCEITLEGPTGYFLRADDPLHRLAGAQARDRQVRRRLDEARQLRRQRPIHASSNGRRTPRSSR